MFRRERGQGLVEFALILPILLMIMLAVIETALIFQGHLAVQHAAREAARWAVTYQPLQGQRLDGQPCTGSPPFLWQSNVLAEPGPEEDCDPNESEDEYLARRVAIIRRQAFRAARGLRIDPSLFPNSNREFQDSVVNSAPNFFGVRIWGFDRFQQEGEPPPTPIPDHPGLQGLPIQVEVIHNVAILDPIFQRVIIEARRLAGLPPSPIITVRATTQMINEGVQVGMGDSPVPSFGTPPPINTPTPCLGGACPTNTPSGPPPTYTPTPTPPPRPQRLVLEPDLVTNTLPLEPSHQFTAQVWDEFNQPIEGLSVSFSTDAGGFSPDGVSPRYIEVPTDNTGRATVTIYANEPATATIRAWVDVNGDNRYSVGEITDVAPSTKVWNPPGTPWIAVSHIEAIPLQRIRVSLYDHVTPGSYDVCFITEAGRLVAVIAANVSVDTEGNALNLDYQIPVDAEGRYRVVSRDPTSPACGGATDVAQSEIITVQPPPPDLIIERIGVPSYPITPNTYITVPLYVRNLAPVVITSTTFDNDLYLDPSLTPPFPSQPGVYKAWLNGIGANETKVVTTVLYVEEGIHTLWGQADTSNQVNEETQEDNNVTGPITVTAVCGPPLFPYGDGFWDESLDTSRWTFTGIGNPGSGGQVIEENGTLTIVGPGGSIWGTSDRFWFLYQRITGDFDISVKINWGPGGAEWAKAGLMVRRSTAANSRRVMVMKTNLHGLQFAYRSSDGGTTQRFANDTAVSMPVWVRLVRRANTFTAYYSSDGYNWTEAGSVNVNMGNTALVGLAYSPYTTSSSQWPRYSANFDDFDCPMGDPPPPPPPRPPGLQVCNQIFSVNGLEVGSDEWYPPNGPWAHGDEPGAVVKSGGPPAPYDGAYMLRLRADTNIFDGTVYHPWVRQEVLMPAEIPTDTINTAILSFARYVDNRGADDPDELDLRIRQGTGDARTAGTVIQEGIQLADGTQRDWEVVTRDLFASDLVPSYAYAGQALQIEFYAPNDGTADTWYFLDELYFEVCMEEPRPQPEPDKGSIGGQTTVLLAGIPTALSGVNVWAYAPGGELYYTYSIQDGTYSFYNLPPGTYTVYAEVQVGGRLYTGMIQVTVTAGDHSINDDHILLLPS